MCVTESNTIVHTDIHEGLFHYENGTLSHFDSEAGRVLPMANPNGDFIYEYRYTDHLGSVRLRYADLDFDGIIDPEEEILEVLDYYPSGLRHASPTDVVVGPASDKKFHDKRLHSDLGLAWYEYPNRYYDPQVGRWTGVDPEAHYTPSWSPYTFGLNNPIRFVDPDGRMALDHIDVEENNDGTYTIVGGEANADKNIYVVDSEGNRTGEVVGEMLTEYSFHDNEGNAVLGAVIDPGDNSGQNFMDNEIIGDNPGLVHYMKNATGGKKYDFKTRGIDERPEGMNRTQYSYRGMKYNGKFASGRDIGNMGAGYVAGRKGLSWGVARVGFDALESYQQGEFVTEGQPTQRAQRVGFDKGSAVYNQTKLERQWQKATIPLPLGPKW